MIAKQIWINVNIMLITDYNVNLFVYNINYIQQNENLYKNSYWHSGKFITLIFYWYFGKKFAVWRMPENMYFFHYVFVIV